MDSYIELAKLSVETYARTGRTLTIPDDLPEDFYRDRRGVFVTIYKTEDGKRCLRGCVGTFAPTQKNVAAEIIHSALCASQKDDRFSPIGASELESLHYEVSLLTTPKPISSQSELDARKYGVIVRTADGRCGLLLPDLDGVDSPLQQIEIASSKGGIDFTQEKFSLERFTVEKHKE